jgi:xanthine dehydrogenase YagT iron-sulfur-binding subunit
MALTNQARLGQTAPPLDLHHGNQVMALESFDGQPLVLAISTVPSRWPCPDPRMDNARMNELRAELRGLGAVMVLASDDQIWSFRPDDELQIHAAGDEIVRSEIVALRSRYGVEDGGEGAVGLFVIDGARQLRFAQTLRPPGEPLETLVDALGAAGRALVTSDARQLRLSRRELVVTAIVSTFAVMLSDGCAHPGQPAAPVDKRGAEAPGQHEMDITLNVNGTTKRLRVEPRVSLLDALRERLALTGTKKGCDHGQCGACTVLVDGRRVNACLTLAVMAVGSTITTIEGLAEGDRLHPMQTAFAAEDGLQCGYCTPGQIISAVALLREGKAKTDDEVREQMSGNICRCGAYCNIVKAIQSARGAMS